VERQALVSNALVECCHVRLSIWYFVLDWVRDKQRSNFAFQGMCWEKSFIPEAIWRAGESTSNLVETVHADVNREGISCTLVGGVKKGQYFDEMKKRTLLVRLSPMKPR
jgi:hypothetical protein